MKKTFETAMAELEKEISGLESGELTLADSLASYEKAVALIRFCTSELENAKAKVQVLSSDPEQNELQDFEIADEN